MSFLPAVRIWIILSALASSAGWILSAVGQLNGAGYGVVAGLGLAGWFWTRREWQRDESTIARTFSWLRIRRRFSRPLPLALAGLAAVVLLGGALYPPSNYDALTYRLPRVLHWLAQGRWDWIHTANYRMNNRSCGFEWLMAPVFLATRSDRALFLINFLPFLLLPGLVYSVFTRLGVTARVAWHWMWLLPTGYNFLLQAASLGNDSFAAAYALAAVDFALRAAASRRIADIWFSLLAAALLTGAKSGNLPLLLPWFILFVPLAPRLLGRPVAGLFVILVAGLVSFLPTAVLNLWKCGDWTGLSLETTYIAMHNPGVGIGGNSLMLVLSNFVPTIFPLAGWWNHAAPGFLPGFQLLAAHFEGNFYKLGEIPTEESAGLGLGLSSLLAASLWRPGARSRWPHFTWQRRAVLVSPYVSLLFFFAKSGMMTVARLVSAYYALLLPILLCRSSAARVVRRPWWRWATHGALLLALAAVVLTPARPLWPVHAVFAHLKSGSPLIQRIKNVYLVYADRPDSLAPLRTALPDDCAVVGFVGSSNDPEISLWRPFGRRRVEDVLPTDSAAQIRARGIKYAVVSDLWLRLNQQTLATWLAGHGASLVATFSATLVVSDGPGFWHVVRFSGATKANRN